jgi:hypothetical protein
MTDRRSPAPEPNRLSISRLVAAFDGFHILGAIAVLLALNGSIGLAAIAFAMYLIACICGGGDQRAGGHSDRPPRNAGVSE